MLAADTIFFVFGSTDSGKSCEREWWYGAGFHYLPIAKVWPLLPACRTTVYLGELKRVHLCRYTGAIVAHVKVK